ncbi:MAG TPA: ABC transporter ATP-binding protein [Phycisphaerae bacterium]|nr:ABC transporter ATP-binding protein [Phycisphaerae bacterium]HNU45590.1 ABC transporter ATP-binding protein [Phycisphaerae bacterium]
MVAITEMTNWAVDLIDVRKTYDRKVQALRGVNIQVGRGEIFGLLGPNGAGKSTLVKIMMTVVRPDHAFGTILGRPLGNRRKLQRIGYLPEGHRFPGYLTGMQLLHYYGALVKVPRTRREANAESLLERVGMTRWADARIDKYSKGMLQRLGIAQALLNDPELVVLDEPTDGLDPLARRETRELLLELKHRGTTVFLNSHLLSELEMVCDRVAILIDGLVARQGTLSELTEHTVEYRIAFSGSVTALQAQLQALGVSIEGGHLSLPGGDMERVNRVIDLLRERGITIESVQPHRFSLEDVLVETLGAQGRAASPGP